MMIFLHYLADPGFQVGFAEDVGVDQSTVSKTIWQVCVFIIGNGKYVKCYFILLQVMACVLVKASTWIRFPITLQEQEAANLEWQKRFSMPCAIGVVDCTHIRILKPGVGLNGDEFINRKGVPAINVQATCNASEMFTSIDAVARIGT